MLVRVQVGSLMQALHLYAAGGNKGVVKVGWQSHHRDTGDRANQWPYIPPHYPLPKHIYIEETRIRQNMQDAGYKSHN